MKINKNELYRKSKERIIIKSIILTDCSVLVYDLLTSKSPFVYLLIFSGIPLDCNTI